VWILKPEIHGSFDRVLAAVDVEADDETHRRLNRSILEIAFSISRQEHAALHIVSAWDLWMEHSLRRRSGDEEVDAALASHEQRVRRALDQLLQVPDANTDGIEVHLHRGESARVIRSVADRIEADLMVMGTVCRTGAAGFLIGNTAETVLDHATCSILALKPEGFISPLEMAGQTTEDGPR
jgi:nucleotide-binding universal stress UspA family protein